MINYNKILVGVVGLFVALVLSLGASVTSLVLIQRIDKVSEENHESIERTDKVAAELVRLREENLIATCVAANVARDAVRETIKDSLLALVDPETPLTEAQKLRIELYNERVNTGLPFRDCSPEGIEAFLENQPPDPALSLPDVD